MRSGGTPVALSTAEGAVDGVGPPDAGAGGPTTGGVAAAVSRGDVRACMRRVVHPHEPIETMPTASVATSSRPTATSTTVVRAARGCGAAPGGRGDGEAG